MMTYSVDLHITSANKKYQRTLNLSEIQPIPKFHHHCALHFATARPRYPLQSKGFTFPLVSLHALLLTISSRISTTAFSTASFVPFLLSTLCLQSDQNVHDSSPHRLLGLIADRKLAHLFKIQDRMRERSQPLHQDEAHA